MEHDSESIFHTCHIGADESIGPDAPANANSASNPLACLDCLSEAEGVHLPWCSSQMRAELADYAARLEQKSRGGAKAQMLHGPQLNGKRSISILRGLPKTKDAATAMKRLFDFDALSSRDGSFVLTKVPPPFIYKDYKAESKEITSRPTLTATTDSLSSRETQKLISSLGQPFNTLTSSINHNQCHTETQSSTGLVVKSSSSQKTEEQQATCKHPVNTDNSMPDHDGQPTGENSLKRCKSNSDEDINAGGNASKKRRTGGSTPAAPLLEQRAGSDGDEGMLTRAATYLLMPSDETKNREANREGQGAALLSAKGEKSQGNDEKFEANDREKEREGDHEDNDATPDNNRAEDDEEAEDDEDAEDHDKAEDNEEAEDADQSESESDEDEDQLLEELSLDAETRIAAWRGYTIGRLNEGVGATFGETFSKCLQELEEVDVGDRRRTRKVVKEALAHV